MHALVAYNDIKTVFKFYFIIFCVVYHGVVQFRLEDHIANVYYNILSTEVHILHSSVLFRLDQHKETDNVMYILCIIEINYS